METVKIDALNAKSIVASKDSEISSLQKNGPKFPREKRREDITNEIEPVFRTKSSEAWKKKSQKLKNSKQNIDNTANNTNDTHSEIEMLQKKEQRLRVAFQSTVLKFREAMKLLFGFNIELVGEKASKTQFLITSNADENATLLFNYDEPKRSVSLDKRPVLGETNGKFEEKFRVLRRKKSNRLCVRSAGVFEQLEHRTVQRERDIIHVV